MSKHPYLGRIVTPSEAAMQVINTTRPIPAPQPPSTYPELVTFSAVSSFNLPARCDATLLTPVSGAGSPPLREGAKLAPPYRAQSTPSPQQPTPPSTSRMHWSTSYDVSRPPSQSASPMSVHPVSQGHFEMAYMTSGPDSRTIRDDDIPPPLETPFLGSFGVSAPPDPEPPEHSHSLYMAPQFYPSMSVPLNQDVMMGQRATPEMSLPPHQPGYRTLAPLTAAPILQRPDPALYHQHHKRSSLEELSVNQYGQVHSPGRRNSKDNAGDNRVKKPGRRPARVRGPRTDAIVKAAVQMDSQAQPVPEEPEVEVDFEKIRSRMKDSCTEEQRWLTEAQFKYRDVKGKGMWSGIRKEYNEKFGKDMTQAALQVRYSRIKESQLNWETHDVERLREAYNWLQANQVQIIHAKFKELGGCREIDFNPRNVQAMLVEMGLWEPEEKKSRRRRRAGTASNRRDTASASLTPELDIDETNEGLENGEIKFKREIGSPEGFAVSDSLHDPGKDGWQDGGVSKESARVAREACEQLLRSAEGPYYQ